ncbi:phytanoyl-CoA dioxygenase family protein [Sphingomonas sanxanigenens]|uniref:phytanoyl-CoA dioxygenase family protein n=1 Tax=Sphingomonas sanxanigenens TaxID=397260 RepID=UPI00046CD932|nr:phytanoyl-CoA dioxygenase family protein [Sphingomonas sanxanigenens]
MSARPLRTVLGLPWWLLQLATGAKSFKDNPLIGSKRLNRAGLHVRRMAFAHRMAGIRRARMAARLTPEQLAEFDANGFVRIDNALPQPVFDALREAVLNHEAPAREMLQGDTITRRIAIDSAFLRAVPGVSALLDDPRWRGLARYVASHDSEPVHYVQTILTHRADAPADPQTAFHADTFHPTMKAWFFLTDVAEDEGPLCYVPGSHRLTPERLAWERQRSVLAPDGVDHLSARGSMRVSPEDLRAMGLPEPAAFAVRANTVIVADTCGFHARGHSVRPSIRVEIWSYSRRNPFLPWAGLDPATLPGLAADRVPLMWRARDVLSRWIGQPWQNVGRKRPAVP